MSCKIITLRKSPYGGTCNITTLTTGCYTYTDRSWFCSRTRCLTSELFPNWSLLWLGLCSRPPPGRLPRYGLSASPRSITPMGDSGKVWTICCCAPLHQKDFFWSICLLLHYNQPPIIGTMPIRDIGELPYPHLLCWRAMKVNRSHSVRTNSIFAINSSIVSQNYFNGSHLSPNNTRTCHQLICVDFVTKCRS